MDFLKILKEEWATISMAPFSFLLLAGAMFAAAFFAARWRYGGIIEQLKASKETLMERLHLRSEQTESLREKAEKYEATLAEVVDSGSKELREKTLKFVDDLREFINRYDRAEMTSIRLQQDLIEGAQSEEERQRLWNRPHEIVGVYSERNAEYERRFGVEAVILRDELRSRLPNYEPTQHQERAYQRPINSFDYREVVTDLEMMAKLL
ncbi:hypothetical protein [Pseudomonas lactis]|uniref:hypothetical protein n=1 Tax=Pseudomonas lactis TaxID=1615674 RepID=UPI0019F45599|nr:hypothetical protein [Pseudomonas lactis]MBA6042823.1 hypothetical protein [Pseudomonas lactis]